MDIWVEEERLSRTLGVVAAADVVAGAVTWAVLGRRSPVAKGIARQAVGWGLVDGAIAGLAHVRRQRAFDEHPAPYAPWAVGPRTRRLRQVLALNCGLDVVYVGVGTALARRAEAGSVRRGDGIGIVVQGLLLGWLDGSTFLRLDPST